MALTKIYRGMQNSAEAIEGNFNSIEAELNSGMAKVYEGATYLNASTAINFDASLFKKSMVIWFSRYDATNSAPLDRQFTPHYVNREMVELKEGYSHVVNLLDGAKKFFYVSKGKVVGNAENSADVNKNWCIRYVFVD